MVDGEEVVLREVLDGPVRGRVVVAQAELLGELLAELVAEHLVAADVGRRALVPILAPGDLVARVALARVGPARAAAVGDVVVDADDVRRQGRVAR